MAGIRRVLAGPLVLRRVQCEPVPEVGVTIMAKTYIGKVCAKHPELGGERRAANCNCVECDRESKRNYYAKNPQRVRERAKKYREENHEAIRERAMERYWADPEKYRTASSRWLVENRGVHNERRRKNRTANREVENARVRMWRANNQALVRAYVVENRHAILAGRRRWYANNKEKASEINRRYYVSNKEKEIERARKYRCSPCGRARLYALCRARRAKCQEHMKFWTEADHLRHAIMVEEARAKTAALYKGEKWCVDHIKALADGGLHHPDNMRVYPAGANGRKAAKPWHPLIGQVF